MSKGILGVLIFLVLLFASVFVLALLLLWLLLRKKEAVASDAEAEPSAFEEDWESGVATPALVVAAPDVEVEAPGGEVEEPGSDVEVAQVDAEEPDLDVGVPRVDEEAPELDVESPEIAADVPEIEAEPRGLESELPEAEADLPVADAELVADVAAEPPVPDDLKRIVGIGPKISSVLQAAGITTFAQLAATDVVQLEEILEAESPRLLRLASPTTWPEQAGLAAGGNWDALRELQDSLSADRGAK
jgi:predicted flap endonuclease-1-like 5' DNA nuclease